jgi:ABC-type branched-subunit amino acid transport system ATPase component
VTRNFGGVVAVDAVSFQVHEKEILSIIGPNGAGKTTLFNLITGIYNPTSGAILYEGKRISGLRPHQIVRAGIGRTFQNIRLFDSMTVLDNTKVAQFCRTNAGPLSILLHLPRFKKEEDRTERRAKEVLDLFGARLTGRHCHREDRTLSCADRRFLEIARAVATGATLLMLDEPSAGMSPRETEEVASLIKKLRDDYGYTVIVIEHKISLVKSISDRVIALGCGRKIAEGTYEEVTEDPRVVEAYLGRKRP